VAASDTRRRALLEIDPADLGTLELDGIWVPYVDMYHADFMPMRVKVVDAEYGFQSSMIIFGHGAVLPGQVRELRAAGKKPMVIERDDRYYLFASPP
jgi:hypothetical protein